MDKIPIFPVFSLVEKKGICLTENFGAADSKAINIIVDERPRTLSGQLNTSKKARKVVS